MRPDGSNTFSLFSRTRFLSAANQAAVSNSRAYKPLVPLTCVSVSVSRLCSTSDSECEGSVLMSSTGPSFSVSVTAAAAAHELFPTPPCPTKKMRRVGGSGGAAMGGMDGARTITGGPSAAENCSAFVSLPDAHSFPSFFAPSRPRGGTSRSPSSATGTARSMDWYLRTCGVCSPRRPRHVGHPVRSSI